MNVLVTGGSGFIGCRVVAALSAAGHTVRVIGRSPSAQGSHAEYVQGAVGNLDSLQSALRGMDAVVHCVGIITERKGATFESVVAEGTRNLVAAMLSERVTRAVYVSALGVRADAIARYHQTKWEAEEALRQAAITHTILRPSIVVGRGDAFIGKFMKMPFIPLPAGGNGLFQPIFVDDLADVAVRSLTTPAADNQTLDCGGPEQLSFKEIMRTALQLRGRRKPMIVVPMTVMHLVATVTDPFQYIFPPLALVTLDQYKMLQENSTGDNSHLLSVFPNFKLHTLREALSVKEV